MKANEFLKLVGLMMTAQADYFAKSKKFGSRSGEAIAALVKSKDLEKQVRAVVKEGVLEPDEPQPTVHIYTTTEYQEQLDLMEKIIEATDEEYQSHLVLMKQMPLIEQQGKYETTTALEDEHDADNLT